MFVSAIEKIRRPSYSLFVFIYTIYMYKTSMHDNIRVLITYSDINYVNMLYSVNDFIIFTRLSSTILYSWVSVFVRIQRFSRLRTILFLLTTVSGFAFVPYVTVFVQYQS